MKLYSLYYDGKPLGNVMRKQAAYAKFERMSDLFLNLELRIVRPETNKLKAVR